MHEYIFFHLIFPGANIFLVLRPPPSPNKFSNGPSLIISDITDTGVSSAVRVIGVSVIARCPQGESWLYFVNNNNNNNNNKMTLNTFHRPFFNKVIDFIVTGISFHERQRSIYSGAALKNFFLPNAALLRGRWLIEGAGR